MAKAILTCVHDLKAEVYQSPLFMKNRAEAVRAWDSAVNSDTMFSKWPGDYRLMELGEWDEETGVFTPHPQPVSLGLGVDFKRPSISEIQQ